MLSLAEEQGHPKTARRCPPSLRLRFPLPAQWTSIPRPLAVVLRFLLPLPPPMPSCSCSCDRDCDCAWACADTRGYARGCARRRFSRRRRGALPRKRWSRSRVGGAARSLPRGTRRLARAAAEVGGAGGGERAVGAAGDAGCEDPRSVARRLMCVRTVPIVTLGFGPGAGPAA